MSYIRHIIYLMTRRLWTESKKDETDYVDTCKYECRQKKKKKRKKKKIRSVNFILECTWLTFLNRKSFQIIERIACEQVTRHFVPWVVEL